MKFLKSQTGLTMKALLGVMAFISLGNFNLHAAEIQTVDSLNNQDIVLNSAIEFHINNGSNAMTNSSIDITHPDAMLVFENVRPSAFSTNYRSFIKINGATLVNGSNGRIAIYKQGTAILPHGSGFEPLTVFTEADFSGESSTYGLHTFYKALGTFDNSIQSFKLKRGYMATFANNADGSGYSRVFIANNDDIEINMPGLLANRVSFIRVLKHQWVNKKGKAGWNPDDIEGTSYYDWNIGGGTSLDHEYAAIRQNGGWPSWDAIYNKENISHLLGFNEPDRPDQSDMTMDAMISQWPSLMKSGLRIGSPAWSSEWNSVREGGNLFTFMERCEELNYRVDFVAVHCYWVKSPQQWYNDLKYIHDRTGRPLWITEWNNGANWTTENWPAGNREYNESNALKQLNDMKGILEVLDTASFVERYFIYDWVQDCRAMVLGGNLTRAGEYYAENTSEIAYLDKNEVIPGWNAVAPSITTLLSVPTLRKHLLQWNDPNNELTASTTIERKINDGDFEAVYTTTSSTNNVYQDPYQEGVQGTVQFRVKCTLGNGSTAYSDTRSISVTSGQDSIQVAKFLVSNFNDQTCVFPQSFTNDPSIILGPVSYRNSKPQLTKRISKLDDDKVDMRVETWAFQSNDIEDVDSKPESISFLALPEGNYDMEGLKAEVKNVAGVSGAWKQILFDEAFDNTPVVFASQVTDKTSFPTTVKIKNITNTGFQIILQKEAAQAGSISSETVSYFAAEEGSGILDGKRLTVGKTGTVVGDLLKQGQIIVDDSYGDPALFAELQTANDNITSSLRYFDAGLNKRVFKQRETSMSTEKVALDALGYMVIDMAPGQFDPIQKLNSKTIKVYPNPAKSHLIFKLNQTARVEIYNLTGSKVIDEKINTKLNVEALRPGMYIIYIDGKAHSKFMKI